MGKKIFVSYKFKDDKVKNLSYYKNSTVRDYVNEFEKILDSEDDIYKGEEDDEDLSHLSDDTIWEKLKNRIYDSTVTVVFISPGMKKTNVKQRDQWIPWEISYSLKEISRKTKNGKSVTSRSNAMVGVVLPDEDASYEYYFETKKDGDVTWTCQHTDILFAIMRDNMFNKKNASKKRNSVGETVYMGDDYSYIMPVKWSLFIKNYKKYVDMAVDRQDAINEYDIEKEVK